MGQAAAPVGANGRCRSGPRRSGLAPSTNPTLGDPGRTVTPRGDCPVPANNSPPKPGRGDSKEGAAGDRALEVGTDHGAELLTPDLEVDGVKQLGALAVEFSHVDLNVRAAGEQDDGDIRELYQPHGAYGAPPMQRH